MKQVISVITILLISVGMCLADTKRGDREVSGMVQLSAPTDGDTIYSVIGSFGYFVTDRAEIKALVSVTEASGNLLGTAGVGADYMINPKEELIPFFGASISMNVGESGSTEDDALADFHVGLKQFVGDNAAINFTAEYLITLGESGDGAFRGLIGLSLFF
ncbi:hypothetical protein ACFLS1_05620 [Verrucomicrobiota bacterium]